MKSCDDKNCYVCGKPGRSAMDWIRQESSKGLQVGKASSEGKAEGSGVGKGNRKVNNVYEKQYD